MIIDFSMWEWPQYTMIALSALAFIGHAIKASNYRGDIGGFAVATVVIIAEIFILACGGFYS